MAQLSRPYQILLGAAAVLALVWFAALRGHGSSPSEPAPSTPAKPSASAPAPSRSGSVSAQDRAAGAPTPVYHGSAPGMEGLTRAIARAHAAVAVSQHDAAALQRKSAQASGEATRAHPALQTHPASRLPAASSATGSHGAAKAKHTIGKAHAMHGTWGHATGPSRPAQQVQVERELTHGKTVVLLFWYPRSTVDASVRTQALALGRQSKGELAVHVAHPDQVGLFGPVTEVAHVYQTPTVLIINKHGLVSMLTGLTDVFSLKQAVREAEHANR